MSEHEVGVGDAGQDDLLARLDEVLEEAGIYVATEIRDGVLFLSGEVDSVENREAALDVATALAERRGLRVDDSIDVVPQSPEDAFAGGSERDGGGFGYVDPDVDNDGALDAGFEAEPDFTDDLGTTDSEGSAAEAIPYFPPTDPVVRPDPGPEELAVGGGFGATSMDDDENENEGDSQPDDDISEAVRRELAEDSLTTDLRIGVTTYNGIVFLHGTVPTLEDVENAEAVAGRVGGVQEVREQLVVRSMRR